MGQFSENGACRPLIGVTAQIDGDGKRWIRSTYADAICKTGGVPVFLDYLAEEVLSALCTHLDGILFTGGVDIHPRCYGEEVEDGCGEITEVRDSFELALYRNARERSMPILGICRGMQLLNVAEGGTLWQNMEGHRDTVHVVHMEADTVLREVLGAQTEVNSFHHQAVKDVGEGCCIAALAEDGMIEAIIREDAAFWIGVQWHPELLCEDGCEVFASFVRACARYQMTE